MTERRSAIERADVTNEPSCPFCGVVDPRLREYERCPRCGSVYLASTPRQVSSMTAWPADKTWWKSGVDRTLPRAVVGDWANSYPFLFAVTIGCIALAYLEQMDPYDVHGRTGWRALLYGMCFLVMLFAKWFFELCDTFIDWTNRR